MAEKKQPIRTCIACRKQSDKHNLLRIVKNDTTIKLDVTGKLSGRGAYICNDVDCIEKCIKTKAINRAFRVNADASVYSQLKEDFLAGINK